MILQVTDVLLVEILKEVRTLRHLHLGNTKFTGEVVNGFLIGRGMEELTLHDSKLSDSLLRAFAQSSSLKGLGFSACYGVRTC